MDADYYRHRSTGVVQFDPGLGSKYFDPHWAILLCDEGIVDFYAWLLRRQGVFLLKGSVYGAHVSFIKGEPPGCPELWGVDPGPVEFHYATVVRRDNGRHAWLDVWCPALHELRARLGLSPRVKESFHLTLGRLA